MSLHLSDKVAVLLEQALAIPESERQAFIEQITADDFALRTQLKSLITAANDAPNFIRSLSNNLGITPIIEGKLQHPTNQTIGAYRIIKLLGRGGMGVVYLAERSDGQFDQQVAIKMLPFGSVTPEDQARFISERQILANLQHPNIARLLDGGIDNQGTPYFVMEFVDGLSIDDYCRNKQLSLEKRLHLFIEICNAIGYAHRNLVIHRDLKPNNILIDKNNVCKLLDFGVAKLIDEHEEHHRQTTALPMTRHYAAPEMLRGDAVSISTDIYSLGVLLYVLLCDQLPHHNLVSAADLERAITQGSPKKPSAVVDNPKLKKYIVGDLDAVVCKAMEAVPSKRYLSVEEFKKDINRFLSGHPVEARPVNRWYSASKFYQRHKLVSSLSLAALFTIVTTAGIAVWQANQAIAAQQKSDRVREFLTSILVNTQAFATSAELASIPDLLKEAANNLEEHFPGQTEAQVEMLSILGLSYVNLGLLEEAESLLSNAETKLQETNNNPSDALLIELYNAQLSLYRFQGRLADMESTLVKLEELIPNSGEKKIEYTMNAAGNRVHLNIDKGDYLAAIENGKNRLQLASDIYGPSSFEVFISHNMLAIAYSRNRDAKQAMHHSELALSLADSHFDNRQSHAAVLDTRTIYAMALWDNGQAEESIVEYKKVAKQALEELGLSAPITVFAYGNLSNYLASTGRSQEALEHAQVALTNMLALMPQGSISTALVQTHMGRAYLGLLNFDEAIKNLSQSRNDFAKFSDPQSERYHVATARLALAYAMKGDFSTSTALLDSIVSNSSEATLHKLRLEPAYLYYSGTALRLIGNTETAKQRLQAILNTLDDSAENSIDRFKAMTELSKLTQNHDSTIALLQHPNVQRFIYWEQLDVFNALDAETTILMGNLIQTTDPEKSIEYLNKSYQFLNNANPNSRWTGFAAFHYGEALRKQGKTIEAEVLLQQAKALLENSPFPGDEKLYSSIN